MTDHSDLSIVIPAFNEEKGIAEVLIRLRETMPGAQVIVVDDGSQDATAATALANAAPGFDLIVMQHPFNQGYGASLKTGMLSAEREYVAWFDADNEHRVEDLQAMVGRMRTERLVAVIGQRPNSVNAFRALGKTMILLLVRLFSIKAGRDLNCGLRVFRRDVITNYLTLMPARYSASLTTTILIIERGYPMAFHPVTTGERVGTSKVRARDGFLAMAKVMNLITLFAPMRIFFRGGVLMTFLGLVYGTTIAVTEGLGFPVAGLLLIMAGFLLAVLGLLAEQIGQMRISNLPAQGAARRLFPPEA